MGQGVRKHLNIPAERVEALYANPQGPSWAVKKEGSSKSVMVVVIFKRCGYCWKRTMMRPLKTFAFRLRYAVTSKGNILFEKRANAKGARAVWVGARGGVLRGENPSLSRFEGTWWKHKAI